MIAEAASVILISSGIVWVTIAAIGMIRMPDTYLAVHALGKAVTVGVASIALGSIGTGDIWIVGRALLVSSFVVLTAPISAHAVARAAYGRGEEMVGSDEQSGGVGRSASSD